MSSVPVDQEARNRALDAASSFHLDAPAGSGKTSVLLARYLRLLANVQAPEELLALTFTRKAAGELKARVVRCLSHWTEPGPEASPVDRLLSDLAREAFRHLDRQGHQLTEALAPERLQILTFHGLCSKLVSLAPQEAGAPLEFTLLEGPEAEWVKEEAVEELRRRLAFRPPDDPVRQALVGRLVRLNNDWPRLAGELRALVSKRDCLKEFLSLAHASRDPAAYRSLTDARLGQVLAPDLTALSRSLASTQLGREWGRFWEYLHSRGAPLAVRLSPEPPGTRLEDVPAWQHLAQAMLTKEGQPYKKFPAGRGLPRDFNKSPWAEAARGLPADFVRLLNRYREIPPPLIYAQEVDALQDLIILLGAALEVYEAVCRQHRALDFIALEEATLRLLEAERPSEMFLRLDCRFQHLLVDEFQDTSERQKELLCRLLEGWKPGWGRTLTVVGDPKQSIYGWRDAKVSLFLEARRGLPCEGGVFPLEPLVLTTNFRASRTLISWVNQVFGDTVLREASGPPTVPFEKADPAPGAAGGEAPHLTVFLNSDGTAGRTAEANRLASQVALALSRCRPEERLGILLFARTHLSTYLAALHQVGVAVRVKEGLKLKDSRVVQHLHNLCRALVRPHDDLAWAAMLTGPWAPQPLAVVSRVAQAAGGLWPHRLEEFTRHQECPPDLKNLVDRLMAAREQVGLRSLEAVVRDFLDEAGAWKGIASREGPLGVANALAYLDLVAQAETALPEYTFRKVDFALAEAYQPPDPGTQDSPVELMTVHSAKGLEFDWVFLPYLDWQPLASEAKTPPFLLEEIPASRQFGLALAPPYWQKQASLLYRSLKRLNEERLLAEARRVFYVAVTRAKRHLMLSGLVGLKADGGQSVPPQSPLAWLLAHYRPGHLPRGAARWAEPPLEVTVCQDWEAAPPLPPEPAPLPAALPFAPEPSPYRLTFPTQPVSETPAETGEDQAGPEPATGTDPSVSRQARVRGEIIHRLLETGLTGESLPDPHAVAAALVQAGLAADDAAFLAPEALAEAQACLSDPTLARFIGAPPEEMKSEWLLEDAPALGVVRRGRLDLLVKEGEKWWLVDFKTSRPPAGVPWEDFLARETEKYRPQLLAYREMAAGLQGLEPQALRLALYFTACRRLVPVE
jgi:ATP-dependent exoDNAse (exonuclease V) beta subunit